MRDYHQLEIWHRSMDFAVRIYEFAADLPEAERYNLQSQLRRAAASVPLNVAEDAGCDKDAEFAQFLGYAYRSLKEVMTALELSERIYSSIARDSVTKLTAEGDQIARMIHALRQRLRPIKRMR
jgi:four helix bundle protein